jgi:AcrR family transcriptional regulator
MGAAEVRVSRQKAAKNPGRARASAGVTETAATTPADTGELLLLAARAEFGEHGYGGTDSNKIARRAGFAPQTFYRWYDDKTAIFVAVYQRWQADEYKMLSELVAKQASGRRLMNAVVGYHRQHLVFRRSLRRLAAEDDVVRRARADSRLRQIEDIVRLRRAATPVLEPAQIAVTLLQIERLADAIAEDELADLGLPESAARAELVSLLSRLQ